MTSDSDLDSNISLWQSSSSWPAPSLSQSWPLVTWILERNLPPGHILTTTKLSPLQISLWWWNGWFMFWQDISSVQLWKRICRVMSVWVDAVLQWCLQCCSWSAVLPPPPVFKQANYATCDLEPERGLDFYVAFLDAVLCAVNKKNFITLHVLASLDMVSIASTSLMQCYLMMNVNWQEKVIKFRPVQQ